MFDLLSGSSPLSADSVNEIARSLSAALDLPSGLDDAARIDAIRACEELVCVLTAAQAALTVELDQSQQAQQAACGAPPAQQGRGVAAQVALARRVSPHRGQRYLGLAKIVASELPHTWAAWSAGRITEWRATLVARETACLTREDRAAVDAAVAGCPDILEAMGDRELITVCQQEAYRLDPESYVTRRRRAEADRSVTLRPAPDAMAWMTALLPVKDAVATYAALARGADSARALGDPRSRGQVMADTLVQSVLTAAAAHDDQQTRWHPEVPQSERVGGGVALGLVMSDAALFGTSDEPAHLDGYGPIPAELAREIMAGACNGEERVWLTRLYTNPRNGELVAMDSRSRRFRNSLARFIRLRDRVCRTPWCDAPIRHIDHPQGASSGGETSAVNGQGLCEACNYVKEALGWSARGAPDDDGHTVATTTPTGHTYRSRAPRLVRFSHTPFVIDWVLAG